MGRPDQPRGPDGRWIPRRGGALAAITLAVLVGAGGVSAGAGGLGTAGGGSSLGSGAGGARVPGGNTASARGKARDRSTARVTTRLIRNKLRVQERGLDADTDCVAHSYGQVQDYFRRNPCTALFRALLEVRDSGGNVALIAVAWVDMPDSDQARRLQQLMDRPGTGNITELSREQGGQRFTGRYYRSAREDTTVVNAQAEPVGRALAAIALASSAVDTVV